MSEPARLRIVCTPIGNVADLSPRALAALSSSALILAEDTRHTRALLDRLGVGEVTLLSSHQHNELSRVDVVIEHLQQGQGVSVVSDAGAPSVSDPGGRLVEAVVHKGYAVEVFPGPSAVTAALMGAGLDTSRFAFLGFLPKRGKARAAVVSGAARAGLGLVIFEAPGRVDETLADLFEQLGPRRVVVARELTKLFETFHRGTLGGPLSPPLVDKGEAVVVVEAPAAVAADAGAFDDDESLPPKERAKKMAQALGISTKEAYARLMRKDEELVRKAQRHLVEAAAALREADDVARARAGREAAPPRTAMPSDTPGADDLMALLDRQPSLRAPLEAQEATKALLSAASAVDGLLDALSFERGDEP